MAYANIEKKDAYQIITDRIIEKLESGVIPWHKPWSGGVSGMPRNLVSGKGYQGINIILLGLQGYDSPYWLTFKQAQERGGHVRKGEHGSPCIFWKTYEKERETPEGEVEVDKRWVLRYYTVFNADQCEGIDAPKVEIKTYPENERIEEAERIQIAMPNRPEVVFEGSQPRYNVNEDKVTIPELYRFDKSEEFYSALFHELAHSTGHESRLNRDPNPHAFGSQEYAQEELIAEITSTFLCGHCGIERETLDNSAAYIQGWLKALRNDKKMVVMAAAQAQRAANYILNIKAE